MTICATMIAARSATLSFGPWRQTWAPRDYAAAVERVRDAIARGDVYQVNLVQHLAAEFAGDPGALAARLAPLNPHNREPYRGDGWAIVSGSPELFLARRGRRVWTCPIKGTRPAGAGAARELARSVKDAAEHVMIVDLERNDLSRICEPGSVRWPELMATRALAGVEHMVSTVEGTAARRRRPRRDARGDVPRGVDHGRAEDRGRRPDRRDRAGRAWRFDGRARAGLWQRRPRSRADDPDVRDRRGADPPLGRRRRGVGLELGGGDRRVVGQGRPAAARDRRASRRARRRPSERSTAARPRAVGAR